MADDNHSGKTVIQPTDFTEFFFGAETHWTWADVAKGWARVLWLLLCLGTVLSLIVALVSLGAPDWEIVGYTYIPVIIQLVFTIAAAAAVPLFIATMALAGLPGCIIKVWRKKRGR